MTRLRGWAKALLVVPVAFNAIVLRGETRVVENLNDGTVHAAMIRAAARSFRHFRIPLDVWFPFLSTGSANFHQYQSFPHIVTGLLAAVIGGDRAYVWSLYLLLSLWPLAVYAGARLLDLEPPAALAAAFVASLVSSVPGYGYEWISYTFGGLGVWTQAWGMWLLPLSLGLSWQAIHHRRHIVPAAVVLALAIVSHILTGYFAALAVVVWVIVGLDRKQAVQRVVRGAAIGVSSAAASAWLLIPFLTDKRWITGGSYTQGFWRNSFGLHRVLGWLVTGNLFDRAFMPPKIRFPLITILLFAGVLRCGIDFAKDVRARALLALFAVSIVLFAGRPTFGFVLDRLPGSSSLLLHRYILAVHMSGVLLAGVGGAWAIGAARRGLARAKLPRAAAAVAIGIVAVLVLLPAWTERAHYAAWSGNLVRGQASAQREDHGDRAALIELATGRGDGRVYAGLRNNWGQDYKVGFVPGYASVLNHDADSLGFTFRVGSMVTDAEPFLDDRSTAQLDAFGIKYLVMPVWRKPSVPAREIEARGDHVLWETQGSGYVDIVDTVQPIAIRTQLGAGRVQTAFLRSRDLRAHLYPTVAYLGSPAARPTASDSQPPAGAPGIVHRISYAPESGYFHVRVTANRTAAVVLKSSYHSRWRVRVDGRDARKYMVALGYPAVTVTAGTHDVEFRYIPVSSYPWLFLIGLLVLLALYVTFDDRGRALVARRRRRVAGPLGPEQSDLADDRGDRAVLLANAGTLHRDEEEQQQKPDVEGEVDPASDA